MESETLHSDKIAIDNSGSSMIIRGNEFGNVNYDSNGNEAQASQTHQADMTQKGDQGESIQKAIYIPSEEPPQKKSKLEESDIPTDMISAVPYGTTSDTTGPSSAISDIQSASYMNSQNASDLPPQNQSGNLDYSNNLKGTPTSNVKVENITESEPSNQHLIHKPLEEKGIDIENSVFSHINSSNGMSPVKSFSTTPTLHKNSLVSPNNNQMLRNTTRSVPVSNDTEGLDIKSSNSINPSIKKMKNRLLIIYDQPRYTHMKWHVHNLKNLKNETLTTIVLNTLKNSDKNLENFDYLNLLIEYNDEFEANMKKLIEFIAENPKLLEKVIEIGYHFHFDPQKKWQSDYKEFEKDEYKRFLEVLNKAGGQKVTQCSIINKYEINTIYLTEKNDLAKLGQEIQEDIVHWVNLRIFDYGENCIRFLPGVKFSESLEVLNIGGGYSLETLAGFKMPSKLKTLIACNSSITSIDNVSFPTSLQTLQLHENRIYFLNYVEFPSRLEYLDVSQNRIDNLRGVNFPRSLKTLSLSSNPIECIKGAKFPDILEHLDLSCIPNESMTGVKFPDTLISLNLQESMTNTRGLKLPPALKIINLVDNGVNSINPLKLPNSIEKLYLNNNNIKTLNKVQFPISLKELYLGNNLITTLKNVQFPAGLEVLDLEMDPDLDENDKHITTLKDVLFPPNLKVLKLGYHSIKSVESIDFPYNLECLSLAYNELKIVRNIRFGLNLRVLDFSGNQDLTNIDHILIPDSVIDLRVPHQLLNNLPAYIVDRANKGQLVITKSAHY